MSSTGDVSITGASAAPAHFRGVDNGQGYGYSILHSTGAQTTI
jgi:hypothetical protein